MNKAINPTALELALEQQGWTQAQLAKQLDVSAQSVTNWLKGESFPRPATLLKLAMLLRLNFEQLVTVNAAEQPIIAFRKKGNAKTTEVHRRKATEIGLLLKPLVPYLPERPALRTSISLPSMDYSKLQLVAAQTRERLGLGHQAVLNYQHLIGEFKDCGAILIPVLWGEKGKHENAMHIRLPQEDVTFIFVNLDTKVEDFKFWMAHELVHVYTPSLTGTDEGEDYADALAAALLFPQPCAAEAYDEARSKSSQQACLQVLQYHAIQHNISLNTVYQCVQKYAEFSALEKLKLSEQKIHQSRVLQQSQLVSATLFDEAMSPSAKHYIAVSEEKFDSSFFPAFKQMILDKGIEAGYLQQVLDIALKDAHALYEALTH